MLAFSRHHGTRSQCDVLCAGPVSHGTVSLRVDDSWFVSRSHPFAVCSAWSIAMWRIA